MLISLLNRVPVSSVVFLSLLRECGSKRRRSCKKVKLREDKWLIPLSSLDVVSDVSRGNPLTERRRPHQDKEVLLTQDDSDDILDSDTKNQQEKEKILAMLPPPTFFISFTIFVGKSFFSVSVLVFEKRRDYTRKEERVVLLHLQSKSSLNFSKVYSSTSSSTSQKIWCHETPERVSRSQELNSLFLSRDDDTRQSSAPSSSYSPSSYLGSQSILFLNPVLLLVVTLAS